MSVSRAGRKTDRARRQRRRSHSPGLRCEAPTPWGRRPPRFDPNGVVHSVGERPRWGRVVLRYISQGVGPTVLNPGLCERPLRGRDVKTANRRHQPPGLQSPRRLMPPVHKNPGRSVGGPVSRVLSRTPVAGRPVTIIFLAPRLPVGSSSLPADRNGSGRPCPLIWPCFRWGLPPAALRRTGVSSYLTISPLPETVLGIGVTGLRKSP